MTIIEVEGTNVHPLVVDSLEILVGTCVSYSICAVLTDAKLGQRYSVVVSRPFFPLSSYGGAFLTYL
jgi:hypothetical protein